MTKIICILLFSFGLQASSQNMQGLRGAWKSTSGDETTILLFEDGYMTSTTFTKTSFVQTQGGTYKIDGDKLLIEQEFNTGEKVLETKKIPFKISTDNLVFDNIKFSRIDKGISPLAGVWKISGRMQDGTIQQIHQRGTRKTLKMLTGTRFQWFAIDPAGNQFSGTGGGTYTFENGKYTEHIDFFSRDSSRIGASLSFDGKIEDGKWHHSGLSSKGDTLYEIWEKSLGGY